MARKAVLTFVSWYLPGHQSGGPVKTISNLVDALGGEYRFLIATRDRDLNDAHPYQHVRTDTWNRVGNADVYYVRRGVRGVLEVLSLMWKTEYDLVYLNGVYSLQYALLPLLIAKSRRKRLVVAPRGQLSRGAIGIKSLRKRVFIRCFRVFRLHRSVCWQASSDYERQDIEKVFGTDIEIQVAGNIASRRFASRPREKRADLLRVVFISRISPMKNIDYALRILSEVGVPTSFDLYGPVEDSRYWSRCQEQLETLPENVTVRAMGPVAAADVIDVMKEYDLFFFPTKGENYGHVITEAFCAGLPALISDRTPWRDLDEKGIGWDLDLASPQHFVERIHSVFEMGADEHLRLRQRVLDWAVAQFSKNDSVDANRAMFECVLDIK